MDNWRDSKIEELCTLHYGKSPKGIDSDNGIYPIYGTGGIVGSTNDYLYDKPSIILGRKGSIGNIHYVDKPFWTIDTTFYVEAKNCDTKWLYYLFSSLNIEKLNEATGVPSLSRNNIYAQMLKAPSDQKEQQKIAEVLSTVDKKIDLIDQKIAETEKLKTGLMQKLFSEGVGVQDENGNWQPHTDFKPSGYPDCWKVMQLKSIANVITGKTPPPANTENYGGDYMFVSPSDLGSRKYISHTKSTLSKQGVNNGKVVPKGAIFFTCIGSTIGKIGISTQECCTNQQINTVILEKDGYMSEYIYYALSHISGSIKRLAGIQAVPIVKKSLFESQFIPIPPQEEQQLIAETLATVDLKLDILYKQKVETQKLKKGLMQKLLTGEWRVPIEETEAA
ncbi:restriction endonuclease subunit S [Shewanella algae]|uniref:restriction endonuclease subunit S n=1 Tax=Shewanella algae TaxID=38313 RepID=UPI001AAC67BA|nr:restriction endonuclease subunit S [Shewanella algae]MBO2613283.1 restriction endonuclease subunit S [Shewanella algae]